MANPFYVAPADYSGARQQLAGIGSVIKENRQQRLDALEKQDVMDAINSGDEKRIADVMIKYPKRAREIKDAYGFQSAETEQMVSDTYQRAISDPENAKQYLTDTMQTLQEKGANTDNMFEDLGELERNPEAGLKNLSSTYAAINPKGWKAMQAASGAGGVGMKSFAPVTFVNPETKEKKLVTPTFNPNTGVAELKEFDIPEGFEISRETPFEKRAANLLAKIQEQQKVGKIKVDQEIKAAAGKENAKLIEQQKLKPQVETAVYSAVAQAKDTFSQKDKQRSNQAAMDVYNTGIKSLIDGLSGTDTGPFIGWMPAMTANQQIADGSIALMAPIMKQMFRAAGEGTFTKDDQEILMAMLPTRKDKPKSRAAKLAGVDAVVRVKLGMRPAGQQIDQQPAGQSPREQTAPQAAIEFLKNNPQSAEQFKAKYGYLP